MIDFSLIKLIIWDLDDTFWNGTLSEGSIYIPKENIKLINDLTDCGVINSICSKNNINEVEQVLKRYNINDLFVFKSINWESKGSRVMHIINSMSLRPANVLFIDDNVLNLKEVEYYSKDIMISTPDIIPDLRNYYSKQEKKDLLHKRLKQYYVLESKNRESLNYSSNEEFLQSCNIHLQINKDCSLVIDRLHELVKRTNQLNFTKLRPSYDEFVHDIKYCDDAGYITVQDRFGDYGIVGLYVIKNGSLQHFLFSCRTIGQGVEQYVYWKLGFPQLDIKGEVATTLDRKTKPAWIHESDTIVDSKQLKTMNQDCFQNIDPILFKGPCDMSGMVGYLQLPIKINTEFTFIDDYGHRIENYNHHIHIMARDKYTNSSIEKLKEECLFFNDVNINTSMFDEKHSIVFLSTLIEAHYGIYERINSGERVAFGHYNFPLTDTKNWDGYISGNLPTFGYKFTEKFLKEFSSKYRYIGRTKIQDYINFLDNLLEKKPDTYICLILGSEIPYDKEIDSSYIDRHEFHKIFNDAVKKYALSNSYIKYIEITNHIKSQKDFSDNINHFTPKIYFELSQEIISILNQIFNTSISNTPKVRIRLFVKKFVQPILLNILSPKSRFYNTLRNIYLRYFSY